MNKTKLISILLSWAISTSVYAHDWNYDPQSIANWHQLEGAELCASGKAQSPINIETNKTTRKSIQKPVFAYLEKSAEVINTGKTIQVNFPTKGNKLTWNGKEYELLQFHFHTPSEEAVDGKRFPLVGHFVHKDKDGELLVIAQLFEIGNQNDLLKDLFNSLPQEPKQKNLVGVDLGQFSDRKLSYFNFTGSLTTPPCSEGVNWFVVKKPMSLSAKQVARFKQLFENNARTIQDLNSREVVIVD